MRHKHLNAYRVLGLLKSAVDRQKQRTIGLRHHLPVRLALDFGHVNTYSQGVALSTPDINDVLQKVSPASFILTFDAKGDQWEIPVKRGLAIWLV